jgi:hypothetical protein
MKTSWIAKTLGIARIPLLLQAGTGLTNNGDLSLPALLISRFVKFMCISTVSFLLLTVRLQCSPAYALPATDDPPKGA